MSDCSVAACDKCRVLLAALERIRDGMFVECSRFSTTGEEMAAVFQACAAEVLALLERKAGEPDGKPDPAPVASETWHCGACGSDNEYRHCPDCGAARPRQDNRP